mmetsp:Transcript_8541/g.14826  ORF Transcript_8541/g.14826 Transcript_8541/m.14826 type:complete len:151 (+) Transcript_8541:655-1107(+)
MIDSSLGLWRRRTWRNTDTTNREAKRIANINLHVLKNNATGFLMRSLQWYKNPSITLSGPITRNTNAAKIGYTIQRMSAFERDSASGTLSHECSDSSHRCQLHNHLLSPHIVSNSHGCKENIPVTGINIDSRQATTDKDTAFGRLKRIAL